jgi:type VI secretion system secreted protein Hcp
VAIYLKIEGVSGDVTEETHKEWIELSSFQWGVGRGIGSPVGATGDRESSEPSVSEIVVTKTMDKASNPVLNLALGGSGSKKFEIDFTRTQEGKTQQFLHYELENTLVSGYSLSSGGEMPSESMSLNFTKITQKFTHYADKNDTGTPSVQGYDLSLAKVI